MIIECSKEFSKVMTSSGRHNILVDIVGNITYVRKKHGEFMIIVQDMLNLRLYLCHWKTIY